MGRSFLSLLRGVEGRQLRLVLAAVLLIGGVLNSVAAGAAAAVAKDRFVICSVDGPAKGSPAQMPANHGFDCCLTGHAPNLLAEPPPASAALLIAAPRRSPRFVPTEVGVVVRPVLSSEGPRGPPLLG